MRWTDRALDYALELGDQRVIAYTLMRKAMIATESGDPARGLGIANSALTYKDTLTPRLRAVILRQRSYSNAALGEVIASARDSDEAVIEAVAGENQGEQDRAPCYHGSSRVPILSYSFHRSLSHAPTSTVHGAAQ
jgi:hypothetical protein